MSNLNAGIILQSQHPNMLRAMGEGASLGASMNELRRQAELRALMEQHGPGIMRGDQNALSELARKDPGAALGIQGQRQDLAAGQLNMDATRQRMRILNAQEERAVAEAARQMSAEERAQQAAAMEQGVRMGMATKTPQQWDSLMQQLGRPELVGRFEERAVIAAKFMDMADVLKMQEPPKAADEYGRYAQEERAQGREPLSRIGYAQAKKGGGLDITLGDGTRIKQGGPAIPAGQNPMGTATPRDPKEMAKKLSGADAAALEEMSQAARSASDLESLGNQLSVVADKVGYTGRGGEVYAFADDVLGVLPGDEGARGAFKSLAMEAQLSFTEKTKGAITDREMGMFRQAVPNLGQRKEANQDIAKVMQAGARRVQTRAAFFENWARKHGSLEGAQEVWSEYMRDNPIIQSDGKGGISVRAEGGWQGYLNRRPAMEYTPESIMGLTAEELSQVPIERMNAAQMDALEARYNQLNGGQ